MWKKHQHPIVMVGIIYFFYFNFTFHFHFILLDTGECNSVQQLSNYACIWLTVVAGRDMCNTFLSRFCPTSVALNRQIIRNATAATAMTTALTLLIHLKKLLHYILCLKKCCIVFLHWQILSKVFSTPPPPRSPPSSHTATKKESWLLKRGENRS